MGAFLDGGGHRRRHVLLTGAGGGVGAFRQDHVQRRHRRGGGSLGGLVGLAGDVHARNPRADLSRGAATVQAGSHRALSLRSGDSYPRAVASEVAWRTKPEAECSWPKTIARCAKPSSGPQVRGLRRDHRPGRRRGAGDGAHRGARRHRARRDDAASSTASRRAAGCGPRGDATPILMLTARDEVSDRVAGSTPEPTTTW